MKQSAVLRMKEIAKTFRSAGQEPRVIFSGLDLTVSDGECMAILGSNGVGKTTLLNLISGTIFPDAGRVFIDDIDVTFLSEHHRALYLGRVFQDPAQGIALNLTIAENLALAIRRGQHLGLGWALSKKLKSEFVPRLAELGLGLEKRLNEPVQSLSGGLRQALALLVAMIKTPRILLLDEYTGALDPKTAELVVNMTKKMVKSEGLTTLLVTHNVMRALEFGNRLIILGNEKIVLDVSDNEKKNLVAEEIIRSYGLWNGINIGSIRQ